MSNVFPISLFRAAPQTKALMHGSARLLVQTLNCQPIRRSVERPAVLDPAHLPAHFRAGFHDQNRLIPIRADPPGATPNHDFRGFAADNQIAVDCNVATGVPLAGADVQLRIFLHDFVQTQLGRRQEPKVAVGPDQLPQSTKIWSHQPLDESVACLNAERVQRIGARP